MNDELVDALKRFVEHTHKFLYNETGNGLDDFIEEMREDAEDILRIARAIPSLAHWAAITEAAADAAHDRMWAKMRESAENPATAE
jgi:hypothetical protein